MNEIEFRIWDKTNKILLYQLKNSPYFGRFEDDRYVLLEDVLFYNDDFELMQYTRIKDKNNIKIYEGDICNIWIEGIKQKNKYVVKNLETLFYDMNNRDIYYRITAIEVVGNIHQNVNKK